MKNALFAAVLSAAALACLPARAQEDSLESGVIAPWLASDSPKCVAVSDIGSVSQVTKLSSDQFQFVRALYVALPPFSRSLPPGDHANMASAGDKAMIAIVSGEQACARFLAPDFVQAMLQQVGRGEFGVVGLPI
jgi:hypothetical protein